MKKKFKLWREIKKALNDILSVGNHEIKDRKEGQNLHEWITQENKSIDDWESNMWKVATPLFILLFIAMVIYIIGIAFDWYSIWSII